MQAGNTGASESDRILAAGVEIPLANGVTARLRYSLRSLKALEDHFGSVADALDALNGLYDGRNKKNIGTIIPTLAAGLDHAGYNVDDLYDGVALHDQMPAYLDAITQALDEAFPPARPGQGKDDGDAPTAASNGDASTTPPTASATATTASGA